MNRISLSLGFCLLILLISGQSYSQNRSIAARGAVELSDRERDGLVGPVRRVIVESAKIAIKNGASAEGRRVLRSTTTYDARGRKIDDIAYPVESTSLPGKERYKYDDNGNIVEMELRGPDGAIVTKEFYTYVLDELGNWRTMNTSIAVFQDGKLGNEPVEVTYRTITYFYSEQVAQLSAGATSPDTSHNVGATNNSSPVNQSPTKPASLESPQIRTSEAANASAVQAPANGDGLGEPSGARISRPQETAQSSISDSATTIASDTRKPDTSNAAINAKGTEPDVLASTPASQPVSETPQTATSFFNIGVSYLEAGKHEEAVKALGQAVYKDPEYAAAYVKLGLAYSSLRQYKDAIAAFKLAIRMKRELLDAEAYYQVGKAYTALGKHSDALGAFKQAMYIARAEAITSEGQSDKAPTMEELHYHLGLAYHNLTRFNESIKEFQHVVAVNPKFAEAYYGLAACYIGLGDRASAEKQQKILAQLNPELAARISAALATNRIAPASVTDGMLGRRR